MTSNIQLKGRCPTTNITINGKLVPALLDTGNEVTTVTDTWANKHLQGLKKQNCHLALPGDNRNRHLGQQTPTGLTEAELPSGSARCRWHRDSQRRNRHRQPQCPWPAMPRSAHLQRQGTHRPVHPATQKASVSSGGHEHSGHLSLQGPRHSTLPESNRQGSLARPHLHKTVGTDDLPLHHPSKLHGHRSCHREPADHFSPDGFALGTATPWGPDGDPDPCQQGTIEALHPGGQPDPRRLSPASTDSHSSLTCCGA